MCLDQSFRMSYTSVLSPGGKFGVYHHGGTIFGSENSKLE